MFPSESAALEIIASMLAKLLEASKITSNLQQRLPTKASTAAHLDSLISAGNYLFGIEYKRDADYGSIAQALLHEQDWYSTKPAGSMTRVYVLAVPYMGETGAKRCAKAGISWLDLSGNATITASGLYIKVEGRPNLFKRAGRPSSVFAAKSSRLARWFLMHPEQRYYLAQLALETEMDRGYVSRIAARLVADGYLQRNADRALSLRDGSRMLEDWLQKYELKRHEIRRGILPGTSSVQMLASLVAKLREGGFQHAATGLAAAYQYTQYASYRLICVYIENLNEELVSALRFKDEIRGANCWLIKPNDAGIYQGLRIVDEIACVHPVQVYLDLKDHPERAEEARLQLLRLNEFNALREKHGPSPN